MDPKIIELHNDIVNRWLSMRTRGKIEALVILFGKKYSLCNPTPCIMYNGIIIDIWSEYFIVNDKTYNYSSLLDDKTKKIVEYVFSVVLNTIQERIVVA